MPFDAIVHAPTLRIGARLNIAEADQVETVAPDRLAVGAEVRLRFGVCCPALSCGRITGYTPSPESAILAIGVDSWTLRRGESGIATPGLVSENWYVAGKAASPLADDGHSQLHP